MTQTLDLTPSSVLDRYEPLVNKIAGKFRSTGLPKEDLRQAARLGMLEALEKFDPNYGDGDPRLLTAFLGRYAHSYALSHVQSSMGHIPTRGRSPRQALSRVRDAIRSAEGSGLTGSEARVAAADALNMPIATLDRFVAVLTPASDVQDWDAVSDGSEPDLDGETRRTAVQSALATLPPHLREVIEGSYLRDPPLGVRELSKKTGVSTTTVSVRRRAGLAALRKAMGDLEFSDLVA